MFTERVQVSADPLGYRYDMLAAGSDWGLLRLHQTPAIGDTLGLISDGRPGSYRVLARDWTFVGYGSTAWPTGQIRPTEGSLLQLIVEASPGPYVDQAPLSKDQL